MREERRMILTMLQEGKITAAEAQDLLEALSLDQEASKERTAEQWAEVRDRVEEGLDQAREQIETRLKEARVRMDAARDKWQTGDDYPIEGLEDVVVNVERGFSQFAKEFPQMLSRLVNFDFGHLTGTPVEQTYEGTFADGDSAQAFVSTRNGSVKWETWNEPGYKVTVTNKVRAEDEEAAERRAAEATTWEETDNGFRLSAGGVSGVSAAVHVQVPSGVRLQVETETRNGSIRARRLAFGSARFTTANGSIRLDDVDAPELYARTANGSVRISGVIDKLHGTTAHGSIEVNMLPGDDKVRVVNEANWELHSSNGSIRARFPEGEEDAGYRVDLKTVNGRVRAELPEADEQSGRRSRRSVAWESPDFEQKSLRRTVLARTANGSIGVTTEGVS